MERKMKAKKNENMMELPSIRRVLSNHNHLLPRDSVCRRGKTTSIVSLENGNNSKPTNSVNNESVHASTMHCEGPAPLSRLMWKLDGETNEWTLVVNTSNVNSCGGKQNRTNSFGSNTSTITDDISSTKNEKAATTILDYGDKVEEGHPMSYYYNHEDLNIHPHCPQTGKVCSSTIGSNEDALSYLIMNKNDCYSYNSNISVNSITSSLRGNEYTLVEHIIMPRDTIEGLCLRYKTSITRLRQVNQFSGSSLLLAPKRLLIPIKSNLDGIKLQDTTTKQYKLHKVLSECSHLGMKEIQAYLELHDWDLHESIKAAKADIEWEQSQSGKNIIEESKLSIEPTPTSFYRHIAKNDVNVNLRVTQKGIFRKQDYDTSAEHLLELKAIKDAAEQWEELSHPNSYKSYVDESMPLIGIGVPVRERDKNEAHAPGVEDYHKAPPIDFGIEMKDMSSFVTCPAIVTIPVHR